jgi:hypothetical protein
MSTTGLLAPGIGLIGDMGWCCRIFGYQLAKCRAGRILLAELIETRLSLALRTAPQRSIREARAQGT